ncbi:hypothetical protein QF001_001698 [Paraburkholderia youngii]
MNRNGIDVMDLRRWYNIREMRLIIFGLQIRLQERGDDLGHLVERTCSWQRFPSAGVASKGGTIAIAAELGEARHDGWLVVVHAFDQQVAPVGLRDDLFVTEQAAESSLQRTDLCARAGARCWCGWHSAAAGAYNGQTGVI